MLFIEKKKCNFRRQKNRISIVLREIHLKKKREVNEIKPAFDNKVSPSTFLLKKKPESEWTTTL